MSQSRTRAADLRDLLAGSSVPRGSGATGYLGRVVDSGAMPATVPGVYLTRAKRILGGSPGDSPTSSVDDGDNATLTPVLVIGGTVPVAGMDLEAWPVGGTLVSSGGRPCSTATIRVKGCGNGNFPGAWVEVSLDGSVIAEGYSTSSPGNGGVLTFTAPGPGEYSARAKHYRFSDQPSATFEITQCGSIPSTVLQFTTPKDGYTCTVSQSVMTVFGGWPLPDELQGYTGSRLDPLVLGDPSWTFRKQSDDVWLAETGYNWEDYWSGGGFGTHGPPYLVLRADLTELTGIHYTDPLTPPGYGTGFGLQEYRDDSSTSDPIAYLVNGEAFKGIGGIDGPPLSAEMSIFLVGGGVGSPVNVGGFPVRDTVTGDSAAEPWLDD